MSGRRLGALIEREWIETRRNRVILVTMALLPLFLIAITLVTAYLIQIAPEAELKLGRFVPPPELAGLTKKDAFLALMNDQELLDRSARDRAMRVTFRIAEHVEHHHAVGHGGKNGAEPVLAVEALGHEGHGAIDRALP